LPELFVAWLGTAWEKGQGVWMSRCSAVAVCFCVFAACDSAAFSTKHEDGSVSNADESTGGAGGSAAGGSTGFGGSLATGGSVLGGAAGNPTGGAIGSGGLATGGASAGTGGKSAGTGGAANGGITGSGGTSIAIGGSATGGKSTGATGGVIGAGGASSGGVVSGGSATGGISGTGGSSAGNCTVPPDASPLLGWASQAGNGATTTTGGGSATPTTVTNLAGLQAAVKGSTAAVVYVKGVMSTGTVTVGSNKTIVGLCGAEIHGHVEMGGSVNVILRNIKIVGYAVGDCSLDPSYTSSIGCSSGDDAISVRSNAHHVWFDHCDISDGTDGNLDITNGADFVTVSWTKFHYSPRLDNTGSDSTGASGHRFSNLVGGDDTTTSDAGKLNITWHHNWWSDNVVERQPRVRFGKNHIVNNLYNSTSSSYCVRAGIEAQLLVENNAFVGVKNPQEFNTTADQGTAFITSKGNLYSGTSGSQSTGGGGTPFTSPPYTFAADATAGLQAAIQSGAGPK
jgi:pectate lyase